MRALIVMAILAPLALPGLARTAQASAGEVATIPVPAPVRSFIMSKSGRMAAVLCQDEKVRVLKLPGKQLLRTIAPSGKRNMLGGISDDGRWILTESWDGDVTVWDTSTGQARFETHLDHYAGVAAISHDGSLLAIGAMDEPVHVYDLASRRKLYDLEAAAGGPGAVTFSRDDSRIATAGSDTAICVYNARGGKLVSSNRDFLLETFAVDFTPNGKQLLAGGAYAAVDFIDAATGKLVRQMKKTAGPVFYLKISPDGKSLFAVFFHADNMEKIAPFAVWKISSGEEAAQWQPPSRPYWAGWTIDGRMLAATATKDAVHIWRVY
jgi:WD40 repeat protein